jgi:CubicO group peptidase (beta-lactamase class C family)
MLAIPTIHGEVADGFEPVRQAFLDNFTRRHEVGASLCVWHQGRPVVDLWAGAQDPAKARPWQRDTVAMVFSCTKGIAATCLLMLADRGLLDQDAPLQTYWPELAGRPAGPIPVSQLLDHRSGLCAIDRPLSLDDLEDFDRVGAALLDQEPLWPPGAAQGYHGVSYGLWVGQLFARIAGESLGTFLQREVAAPLGLDLHLGLPDEHHGRVAPVLPSRGIDRLTGMVPPLLTGRGVHGRLFRAALKPGSETARAFANPSALGIKGFANWNTPRVWRMELPWMNAITNARGLGKLYATLAAGGELDGVRLVGARTVARVHPRRSWEHDKVLHKQMGWSLGFIKEESHLFSPVSEAFGHPGAGGALGLADPVHDLSIGYVMNRMDWRLRSERAVALCHAIYGCLGVEMGAAPEG